VLPAFPQQTTQTMPLQLLCRQWGLDRQTAPPTAVIIDYSDLCLIPFRHRDKL
jgi:hypothetical protein